MKSYSEMHPDVCGWKIGVKILVLSFIFSVCVGSRYYSSPKMCDREEITDCSFLFPHSQPDSCQVYPTKACESYDFSSWKLKPLSRPLSEADSEFTVNILPYAVFVNSVQTRPVSAVNITMTSLNKSINGFSFVITENIRRRNACRIFDFKKSVDSMSVPFTFYYDCLNNLVEDEWENASMVFKAYPLNIELSYFVYFPPIPKENLTSACDWKPLVMVFQESLPKYDIHIKFSNAPEEFKITFFNIILIDSSGIVAHNRIPYGIKCDMISSEFHVAAAGNYSIRIGIVFKEINCTVAETYPFYVGEIPKDYSFIVFFVLLIVMIISASLLIYFSCQWCIKNATPTSKPTLLLVYSYKRLHHEFLVMYSKYLESHYGVKVNMVYERSGNPKTWLEEKYSQSNIIVFVVSSSLKTLDQDNTGEEEHHWVDQLAEAKALIEDTYIGSKKMCKIIFPYSGMHHIPKCLERQGPSFMLPRDLNKFLCFTFSCPYKLYVLSKIFCENHHKVLNPGVKHDTDEKMKEKLKIVMGTAIKDFPPQKVEKINATNLQSECKLEIEMEKSKFDTSNERTNVTSSDKLSKESKKGNPDFPQQQPNFIEPENDDFMKYCVRELILKNNVRN